MELSERKKQILRAVVENYIQTAEPVGSKAIVVSAGLKVSSATIRNEMAELETLGYLEQPHTSAGRIPSPKGYRLYVNELMEEHRLTMQEAQKINEAQNPGNGPGDDGGGEDHLPADQVSHLFPDQGDQKSHHRPL